MKVVGYTFDADVHCVDCTEAYVRENNNIGELVDIMEGRIEFPDGEGNPIHPIFDTDEAGNTPSHCGDCGAFITDSWSGETVSYAVDLLWEYVQNVVNRTYRSNIQTLDIWREYLKWYSPDTRDDLVTRLYDAAREHDKEG